MSQRGLSSRREAEEYIAKGLVFANGTKVIDLGHKVFPDENIILKSKETKVTFLLNKPVGFVSGLPEKQYKCASTLILPKNRSPSDPLLRRFRRSHLKKLAPAGRLDIDSTGLLVFTQNGVIAKKLIAEDTNVEKEYIVKVSGAVNSKILKRLQHGLILDNKPLKPAIIKLIGEERLQFILREGKKRQIRRMCALVGLTVLSLHRTRIGNISIDNIGLGKWRYLGKEECF